MEKSYLDIMLGVLFCLLQEKNIALKLHEGE